MPEKGGNEFGVEQASARTQTAATQRKPAKTPPKSKTAVWLLSKLTPPFGCA
jgi:hypothetical protein